MWLWSVLWRVSALLLVNSTIDLRFFSQKRQFVPSAATEMNCYEFSKFGNRRFGRAYNEEWRSRGSAVKTKMSSYFHPMNVLNSDNMMSRRMDNLLYKNNDLVKEHAKLVQDINSLKQVVFFAPFDDLRDVQYDDSIFPEFIETSSSTTTRPTTQRLKLKERPVSSFPVILLGGASTRQTIKSQPLSFPKSSISLVGTTSTPLLKHPYPFVMQGSSVKPIRVCMPTLPSFPATTSRPGLLERLISAILPRPK